MYMVTGGLGVANPRIMAWDSGGNMTFGLNDTFPVGLMSHLVPIGNPVKK